MEQEKACCRFGASAVVASKLRAMAMGLVIMGCGVEVRPR